MFERVDLGPDVTLYRGDCLEVLPTLAGVDAVVTDPPYLTGDTKVPIRGRGVAQPLRDSNSVGIPWGYSLGWIDLAAKSTPMHWVVFAHYRMIGGIQVSVEAHALISCLFVWRKSNAPRMTRPVPRLDCEFILWARSGKASCMRMAEFDSMVLDVPMPQAGCFATERILEPGSGKAAHPTQKPLAVIQPFIERLTDAGATVLDPFMGSGTTGVACVQTGRRFIGIEIDPGYFAIAEKRIREAQLQMRMSL